MNESFEVDNTFFNDANKDFSENSNTDSLFNENNNH